jgi:hypothetical protein
LSQLPESLHELLLEPVHIQESAMTKLLAKAIIRVATTRFASLIFRSFSSPIRVIGLAVTHDTCRQPVVLHKQAQ